MRQDDRLHIYYRAGRFPAEVRQMELGIRIGTRFNVLVFADDVLLAEDIEDLQELTKVLIQETDHIGLDSFYTCWCLNHLKQLIPWINYQFFSDIS